MELEKTKLFALHNSHDLGEKVAKLTKLPLSKISKTIFADGEIMVQSEETVRNKNVFIVASCGGRTHDYLMELLLFVDSLKRASARRINVVLTYYPYSRQDRKAKGRQPIGAKLIADLIEVAGVTKLITVDLHNSSIQGFFNIPVDDLKGQYILAPEIKKTGKFTVVSPDHGGAVRARILAELIANTINIAIVDKRRIGNNASETLGVLGNVKGKNVVLIDDMIDTGGTIIKAARAVKDLGAKKVMVAATHGLFSKGFDMFEKAKHIDKVVVTDSIQSVTSIKSSKIKVVSLDSFLAKTIKATIEGYAVSEIYEVMKNKL